MPWTPVDPDDEPDLEKLLARWLAERLDCRPWWEETEPTNMQAQLPLIRVLGAGGSEGSDTLRTLRVDVEAFTSSRESAIRLAGRARRAIRWALPGQTWPHLTVTGTTTGSLPAPQPWSKSVHRYSATYGVTCK